MTETQGGTAGCNDPDGTCQDRRDDGEAQELLSGVGDPFKLTPILCLGYLLDEGVHVIASGIVEEEGDKVVSALSLEVTGIASCTQVLPCCVVMICYLLLGYPMEWNGSWQI